MKLNNCLVLWGLAPTIRWELVLLTNIPDNETQNNNDINVLLKFTEWAK